MSSVLPERYWSNGMVDLYRADSRFLPLADESVHCVVLSPPYYGLRQYGGPEVQVLFGDPEHFPPVRTARWGDQIERLKWRASLRPGGVFCPKGCCWVGALGLEPELSMYVDHMVAYFREIRRVLRPEGTVWLNIGDSYAGSGQGWSHSEKQNSHRFWNYNPDQVWSKPANYISSRNLEGVKQKDLMFVPSEVALALRADGWWVRSRIVWEKDNSMPESVDDRPTSAYEDIYLLGKSERYFYDGEAIAEDAKQEGKRVRRPKAVRDGRPTQQLDTRQTAKVHARNVWRISNQGYKEAHFATFPEGVPTRCILAGTSERGVCAECGAPWERIVERTRGTYRVSPKNQAAQLARGGLHPNNMGQTQVTPPTSVTVGWRPGCECGAPAIPATVLDPFSGSGTTVAAAQKLGRFGVGVDLKPDYLAIAARRVAEIPLPLI